MDATTMRSMSSLIHKLKTDFEQLNFLPAEEFSWSPVTQTVFYAANEPHAPLLLLHELGHATLNHQDYHRDVSLLAMETAAWEAAKKHAAIYKVRIDETVVQDHLDTYRDWLHARSTCPECGATGYQTESRHYSCIACSHEWRVNEARGCALRRYKLDS